MTIGVEFIAGLMFGYEYVQDHEENLVYHVFDLGLFRVLLFWEA